MTTRDQILLLALAGGGGYLMFNVEKYQGCMGNSQTVELQDGDSRPVACDAAELSLVGMVGEAPSVEVSCADETRRATLFGASATDVACGLSVANLETWQGGPSSDWNARLEITW